MPPGECYHPFPVNNPRIEPFRLGKTPKIDNSQFLTLSSPLGLVVEMIFCSLQGTNPRGWAGAKSSPEPSTPSTCPHLQVLPWTGPAFPGELRAGRGVQVGISPAGPGAQRGVAGGGPEDTQVCVHS